MNDLSDTQLIAIMAAIVYAGGLADLLNGPGYTKAMTQPMGRLAKTRLRAAKRDL